MASSISAKVFVAMSVPLLGIGQEARRRPAPSTLA
jgi:hypothetical protein